MPSPDRPNVILIMTDQQRYDILSVHGGPCRTPALERLASEGVVFRNAYSVCALCSPARASIFTGLFPHNHGMQTNCHDTVTKEELLPGDPFLGRYLAERGYARGYVGKWHVGKRSTAQDFGFDGFSRSGYGSPWCCDEYRQHLKERGLPFVDPGDIGKTMTRVLPIPVEATVDYFLADRSMELLRQYRRGASPFFLTIQFWGPHEPNLPTEDYARMYPAESIALWNGFADTLKGKPCQYRRHRDELLETCFHGLKKLSPDDWRGVVAKHYAYNTMIDSQVGRVLDEVDRLGLASNTVVLYTTDHGNYSGSRGFYDKGVAMFEDVYHIPMLARGPGIAPRGTRDQLVSNMDVFSTVLELIGAAPGRTLDSRSLVPLLAKSDAPWPEDLMCEFHGAGYPHTQRMLRWRHYKYVFTPSDIDELYDLAADPDEMVNRIDDPALADVRRELQTRMIRWARASGDPIVSSLTYCVTSQHSGNASRSGDSQ